MTDYDKWNKVDFKKLGVSESDSGSSDDDEARNSNNGKSSSSKTGGGGRKETPQESAQAYIKRHEEIEAAKRRLTELEKEQKDLEKRIAESQRQRNKMEWIFRIGMILFAATAFGLQYYLGLHEGEGEEQPHSVSASTAAAAAGITEAANAAVGFS